MESGSLRSARPVFCGLIGQLLLAVVGHSTLVACSADSGDSSEAARGELGGASGSAGAPGEGRGSGATPVGTGASSSGVSGNIGTGGIAQASGGTSTAGGGPNTGGTGTGGIVAASGGTTGAGGAPNAGSPGTGGTADTGGTTGTGGDTGTGGATSSFDHGILGVYCGNSTSDVTQFETWLGKPVDGILGYTGNASWQDYDGSVGWAVGLWGALDRRVLWSVPLIPTGASLAEAAAGNYDDHYKKAAQTLSTYRPQESVLYIRTGWEFNGDWFPWAAKGKAQDFAGAFRHFVAAFRGVSSRFRFEWNVNVGDVGMNPEDAYPGDDSVDIVGMDFYWNTQWDPKDPAQAWNSMLTRSYGLEWHQDFAKAHGKPTAYSEWGVMADGAAVYIQNAKAWFASHDVVYQTYWNSDNAFQGKLSSGQYPSTGAAYKTAFGP